MIKNTENVSTEDKYLPEHLSYKEKSSKRSLLTEKLKNIESLSSQMGCGDDFEYTNGKILIK